MGIRRGSISTPIIADGLVFNMDAANRASYVPDAATSYNTIDLSQSGSLQDTGMYSSGDSGTWAFDGVDDYIDTNDTFLPDFVSVFVWVKGTATSVASWSYTIVVRPDLPYGRSPFSLIWNGGAMYAKVQLQSTSDAANGVLSQTSTISSIANGNWHCVGLTFNGPSLKFYLNGVQAQEKLTSSITNAVNGPLWPQSNINYGVDTKTIKIGTNDAASNSFDGNIGPVHIYNRALSATEVLHNYNALKGRFGL
jgi:hypothetical protein